MDKKIVFNLIEKGYPEEIICLELDISKDEFNSIKQEYDALKSLPVVEEVKEEAAIVPEVKETPVVEQKTKVNNNKKKKQGLKQKPQKKTEVPKQAPVVKTKKADEDVSLEKQEEVINAYKKRLEGIKDQSSPQAIGVLNLLAFAYSRFGRYDEAIEILEETASHGGNYTTYKELVHVYKQKGDLDLAKLWAEECIDKFPKSTDIREQLISIARIEGDEAKEKALRDEITAIKAKDQPLVYKAKKAKGFDEK